MIERHRRLVFGEVAGLYDRSRPGYPAALVDDLVGWAGAERRALEVGAGTGKATALLAARGVSILAIEPSAEMATYARVATDGYGEVEIVESDFERWPPAGRTYPLIYAGQAWHWVDQQTGFAHARAALRRGGHLVAFWNRPAWGRSALRAALSDAYRDTVPDLPSPSPMHPDSQIEPEQGFWSERVAATDGLADPESRAYDWSIEYTARQYVDLLGTLSEIRLLAPPRREALLAAVSDAIDAHGGVLPMPMRTDASIARAV